MLVRLTLQFYWSNAKKLDKTVCTITFGLTVTVLSNLWPDSTVVRIMQSELPPMGDILLCTKHYKLFSNQHGNTNNQCY